MPKALFKPVPFEEASAFLRSKPVVTRAIFDRMLPEVRALAFTIGGVENFDVLQRARDRIAELPQGGDWKAIKGGLVEDLLPYMEEKAALARSELLLRQHGFQAYRVQQWQQVQETKDVFPFLQYIATHDARTRPSHMALHGLILPVDDPFWLEHMPPWEYGCRCQVIQVDQEVAEEAAAKEMHLPLDQHKALIEDKHAGIRGRLNNNGRLVTGPGETVDVRSPRQRGGSFAALNDLRIPVDALRDRYDPDIWQAFESWAAKAALPGESRTIMGWLRGEAVQPVAPAVVRSATGLDALVTALNIPKTNATAANMETLLQGLRQPNPARRADIVTAIQGSARGAGALRKANIERVVDEFLGYVDPDVVKALPKFDIRMTGKRGLLGQYSHGHLLLNRSLGDDPLQMRRTLIHEMGHWLHLHRTDNWPAQIKAHFEARTAGEQLAQLPGFARGTRGKRDKWYDVYSGRVYGYLQERTHLGIELPSTYLELLTRDPSKLADYWNHPDHGETLRIVMAGFFNQP